MVLGDGVSGLFDEHVSMWDVNKTVFAVYCRFYANIKTAFDVPPPKRIIKNDTRLDIWVDEKQEARRLKLYGQGNTASADGTKKNSRDVVTFDSNILKQ